MDIAENLQRVRKKISAAAAKSKRPPEEVILVAVTKNTTPEAVQAAIANGVTHIGENKVQEILRKYDAIGKQVTWHMIGHLQRNKVKYIIDKVDYIHSLDSVALAREIDKRAAAAGRRMKCLLEVNISGEESKYGLRPYEVEPLLEELENLNNIEIVGLMTMAPFVENPEETRQYFKELRELAKRLSVKSYRNVDLDILSMGMSNDFEVAIEEGASMIRVGGALFHK